MPRAGVIRRTFKRTLRTTRSPTDLTDTMSCENLNDTPCGSRSWNRLDARRRYICLRTTLLHASRLTCPCSFWIIRKTPSLWKCWRLKNSFEFDVAPDLSCTVANRKMCLNAPVVGHEFVTILLRVAGVKLRMIRKFRPCVQCLDSCHNHWYGNASLLRWQPVPCGGATKPRWIKTNTVYSGQNAEN